MIADYKDYEIAVRLNQWYEGELVKAQATIAERDREIELLTDALIERDQEIERFVAQSDDIESLEPEELASLAGVVVGERLDHATVKITRWIVTRMVTRLLHAAPQQEHPPSATLLC